jgi:NAD(P)-dependent dehydrogenase (short-subunit alcohol dehydrogenase family)
MSKILLILGAGPNIGVAVAKSFSSAGYKVASASRSAPKSTEGIDLHIPVDLSKPDDVPGVFSKVRKELGEPSVIVYNGKSPLPSSKDILSMPYKLPCPSSVNRRGPLHRLLNPSY